MSTAQRVLICTVGGSHQPILTSIREVEPDFVCFVCTGPDPATGTPGSEVQIKGKGSVIKAKAADERPTLPSIPIQAGLAEEQFEIRLVPADDLDSAVRAIAAAIEVLERRFPGAALVADYTGGTKTMTAALVVAALGSDTVELRLVTGARGDLVKVHDGSQSSMPAAVEGVRLGRALELGLAAWRRYAYGEAAEMLRRIPAPRDSQLRAELQIAREVSRALDAWDRFDHAGAAAIITVYRPRVGQQLGLHLKFLEFLTGDDCRREPAQLWDLWLNAQRRAAQGRYDDAVARAYRLLEWTAQWLLRARAEVNTSDLAEQQVPPDVEVGLSRDGKRIGGLFAAWDLVAYHLAGEAPSEFALSHRDRLRNHIKARNASILAHGYNPVGEQMWQRFAGWIEEALIPLLQAEARRDQMRLKPPQLPTEPVWDRASKP